MARNKPAATGRQLDWCQMCGAMLHRHELVRTQVRWKRPAGQNYFPYSDPGAGGWTANNLVGMGYLAVGALGQYARTKVSDTNVVSEVNGAYTAKLDNVIDGTAYLWTSSALNISSWTSFTLSACCGPWGPYSSDAVPSQELKVTLGVAIPTEIGAKQQFGHEWTVRESRRVWATGKIADITIGDNTAAFFYLKVVGENGVYIWAENFMLEKNVTRPGDAIIVTRGTAIDNAADATKMSVIKVCPSCRESLVKTSELTGTPRREIEPPVAMDVQEA